MQNWLLQNLSDILNRLEASVSVDGIVSADLQRATESHDKPIGTTPLRKYYSQKERLAEINARREWRSAIATIEEMLLSEIDDDNLSAKQGLVFSAPVPLLSNEKLISCYQSAVFTTDAFKVSALMPCRQSATEDTQDDARNVDADISSIVKLPLIPQDPIDKEEFCLILTANFGLVMVLGTDTEGNAKFHFSFDPTTLAAVWTTLRSRLVISNYHHLEQLDSLVTQFAPPVPDYRLVTNFSRQLLQHLPDAEGAVRGRQVEDVSANTSTDFDTAFATRQNTSEVEMELLQALTHEVRTPLTTIRTLTKLLLKRKQDFKPKAIQRLQAIDRECTEQIERMELIFRAAQLESTPPTEKPVELVPFSLEQAIEQHIPRWQEKAKRRNVDLQFTLPNNLPKIVSDPAMLDTVLTGLMESCTRSLPTGGQIEVKISTAGDRLKLQVLSQANNNDNPFKSLGQLLSFQPATGCLSLNMDTTKNIFQALGGKLTVRQRQKEGKELTIFLPLGSSYQASEA